jgi:hypothetical protein
MNLPPLSKGMAVFSSAKGKSIRREESQYWPPGSHSKTHLNFQPPRSTNLPQSFDSTTRTVKRYRLSRITRIALNWCRNRGIESFPFLKLWSPSLQILSIRLLHRRRMQQASVMSCIRRYHFTAAKIIKNTQGNRERGPAILPLCSVRSLRLYPSSSHKKGPAVPPALKACSNRFRLGRTGWNPSFHPR